VHIFNLLFLTTFLYAQSVKIASVDPQTVQDSLIHHLSQEEPNQTFHLQNFGKDFAEYHLTKIDSKIDTVLVRGCDELSPAFQQTFLNPIYDINLTSNPIIKIAEHYQRHYFFIMEKPMTQLGWVHDNKVGAQFSFSPLFRSSFSGIISANKNEEQWELAGEIDLHLENVFQTGNQVGLFWKKVDSLSHKINLSWFEPHPFGWQLGAGFSFNHENFGGYYSQQIQKGFVQLYSFNFPQLKLGFVKGITTASEKGKIYGYASNSFDGISASIFSDSRTRRFLPRQGKVMSLELDVGIHEKETYSESTFELYFYQPVSHKFHTLIRYKADGIFMPNKSIPKSRLIQYGGISSIRGYEDLSFSSTQIQMLTLEGEYQPNSTMGFTVFSDVGNSSLNHWGNMKTSLGFGLKQFQSNMELHLQYAIPKGLGLGDGKLHVKWVSRL